MKKLVAAAFTLSVMTMPALAQTKAPTATPGPARSDADCQANWKNADKNTDNKLDSSEISAAKAMIPTSLTSTTNISQQEFLTACRSSVQGKKN